MTSHPPPPNQWLTSPPRTWESVEEGTTEALKIAYFQARHHAKERRPYRTVWSWQASGNAGFRTHLLLRLLPPSADKKHASEASRGRRLSAFLVNRVCLPMWWCLYQAWMYYMPFPTLQHVELRHKCRFSEMRERADLTSSLFKMRSPIGASRFAGIRISWLYVLLVLW